MLSTDDESIDGMLQCYLLMMRVLMTSAMLSTDDGIDDMLAMLSTDDEGIDDISNAIYWWWGYWWHATMLSTDDEGMMTC